jgi:hypothetical protein
LTVVIEKTDIYDIHSGMVSQIVKELHNITGNMAYCSFWIDARLLQCTQTDYGVTSFLLGLWKLTEPVANPPAKPGTPLAMQYLRSFALYMAYVKTADVLESKVALRRRMATVLQQLETNVAKAPPMRIVRHRPGVDWPHVWYNLHRSHLSAVVNTLCPADI